jgi:hypothetical protein
MRGSTFNWAVFFCFLLEIAFFCFSAAAAPSPDAPGVRIPIIRCSYKVSFINFINGGGCPPHTTIFKCALAYTNKTIGHR